jgi:hypothetical protein
LLDSAIRCIPRDQSTRLKKFSAIDPHDERDDIAASFFFPWIGRTPATRPYAFARRDTKPIATTT